nr:hypothetical protein Itr_chr07CG18080 [Ipomoea trifida]
MDLVIVLSTVWVLHDEQEVSFVVLENLVDLRPNGLDLSRKGIHLPIMWKFIQTFCEGPVFVVFLLSEVLVNRIPCFIHHRSEFLHNYFHNLEFFGPGGLGSIHQPRVKRFDNGGQLDYL